MGGLGALTDPIPGDRTPRVLRGHALDVLRTLPEDSVHCVVTSPPYWGLRAYGTEPQVWGGEPDHSHVWASTEAERGGGSEHPGGSDSSGGSPGAKSHEAQGGETCACGAWRGELGLEPTPEAFVDHLASVFDEVRRVLRADGTLWLNLGDTYATHPSGLVGEKRWRTSTLANRDFTGHEQAGQMDKRAPGLKPKDLVGIPWRVAFELQQRGWWLRSDCVWAKPNPMPESVVDRPTRSHEYVFLLTKSARYFYDSDAVRTPYTCGTMPEIGAKYDGTATKSFRQYRAQDASAAKRSMLRSLEKNGGANLKSAWWVPTQPYPEAHFATFPEAIPEICIRAGTSARGACIGCGTPWRREIRAEGGTIGRDWHPDKSLSRGRVQGIVAAGSADGTYRRVDLGFRPGCACGRTETLPSLVLDPFAGSGTVLAVARRLGRRSIGIELNREYVKLARQRASADVPDLQAFAGAAT